MRVEYYTLPNLRAALVDALHYVADMTYCNADGEWQFKPGYDPQIILDVIKLVEDT
jgi:hypothetical protein